MSCSGGVDSAPWNGARPPNARGFDSKSLYDIVPFYCGNRFATVCLVLLLVFVGLSSSHLQTRGGG